jgi:hypothetical protein
MGSNIQGQFYSNTITTGSVAGEDLLVDIETTLSLDNVIAKKLTLISDTDISVDLNYLGTYSKLWKDDNNHYKLSTEGLDCSISSIKILDTSASVWIGIIF